MNALTILSIKLEAVYGSDCPDDLRSQAKSFREALHEDAEEWVGRPTGQAGQNSLLRGGVGSCCAVLDGLPWQCAPTH